MDEKKFKHMLIERGETISSVARQIGVDSSNVSTMVNKKKDIRISTLKKICRVLKCKAEDIW